MADHEDDLPHFGDDLPYAIAGMSFLIVKSGEDEYKTYYNSCLHRGPKTEAHRGKQADELRCLFHARA
jgi:phenylpropionate dioxygenase-like ring-hydroxylating dioxygenase large terminal subunit